MINQTMHIAKTVSARFRNVVFKNGVECRGGSFTSSSVVPQLSTVPKVRTNTRLSRDERRALVESYVKRHRATNGGKFPSLDAVHKEVGGSYYIVRDIFQELKSKSKIPSVSPAQVDSAENVAFSLVTSGTETNSQSRNAACDAGGSSAVVNEFVSPAGCSETVETETNKKTVPVDASHPGFDTNNRWSDTPVITATDDELCKTETETFPRGDVESKGRNISHLPSSYQRDVVSDTSLSADPEDVPSMSENFKTYDGQKVEEEARATTHLVSENPEEEMETGKFMGVGGQESKRDQIAELVDSTPLEAENSAREVSDRGAGEVQTRRQGSVWNNIKSLAEGVMNFWRKG